MFMVSSIMLMYTLLSTIILMTSSIDLCFLTMLDLLSLGLVWMTLSALAMTFASSNFSMFSSLLWWVMSFPLLLSFMTVNLIFFYIMFELSLIPILLMILYSGNQPERLSAGMYFLLYTGSMSIPYAVLVISIIPDGYSFIMMKPILFSGMVSLILISPFIIKMPVSGVHFWLPKAHVEASTSGSMILAGILLKLGSYGLFRFSFFLKSLTIYSNIWLMMSLFMSCCTFLQSDNKKFVAYSSVTHMTFMMIGLTTMLKPILYTVLMLSLTHGWVSMGMFLSAGALSHTMQTRLNFFLKNINFHWSLFFLGLLLVANASIPPAPSFFSEIVMVMELTLICAQMSVIFLFLSFFVCYYNSVLFLMYSNTKPLNLLTMSFSEVKEMVILQLLAWSIFTSLGFMTFF